MRTLSTSPRNKQATAGRMISISISKEERGSILLLSSSMLVYLLVVHFISISKRIVRL